MHWTQLWLRLFHTTTLFSIDMGFWVSMGIALLIAILMNLIFWSMKPFQKK